MNPPVDPALSAIIASLPPAASAFLAFDTRNLQIQAAVTCSEAALAIVHKDGSDGLARIRTWDVTRMRRWLGEVVEASNRVIDPRQMELWPDADEVAA